MTITPQVIPDVLLIEPVVHGDNRGYFVETFRQDVLNAFLGYELRFVQDNESCSSRGVLRGLHFQSNPHAITKLVRVVQGEILDVAVDIRSSSPTYGKHVAVRLDSKRKNQLLIPRGFAHGFVVVSQTAIVAYKVDDYYAPECDKGLLYKDPALDIDWILPEDALILSAKDKVQPPLSQLPSYF